MKSLLLISTIILASLAFSVVFYSEGQALQKIDSLANIISSLAALTTLFLALLLYNKFGIENKLLNKNLQTVTEFLKEVSNIRLLFDSDNQLIPFTPSQKDFYRKEKSLDQDNTVVFQKEYLTMLAPVLSYINNPFFPKSIARTLKELEIQHVRSVSKEILERKNTLKLIVVYKPPKTRKDLYLSLSEEPMTYQSYINKWESVMIQTQKWLRKHSSYRREINLDFIK